MQPSLPPGYSLGVVEGFFGRAWSWSARRACAGFLREAGFDTYLYAPKEDAWLRKQWEQPFPLEHRAQLQRLCGHYQSCGLTFGVGLSPYEAYRDFNADRQRALRGKIREINDIGADVLCLLFDDMPGDMAGLAQQQARIMDFAREHSSAQRFILCPTYYSYDPALMQHFGTMPAHYLEDLGHLLEPAIRIFWTGPRVISRHYPAGHLQELTGLLQRKPLIWDNYPVNDGQRLTPFLHLRPFERDVDVLRVHASGHLVNPMNQASLSRFALYSLTRLYAGDRPADSAALFSQACEALCPAALGRLLMEDIGLFQDQGLNNLSNATRERLLQRYRPFAEDPLAREIIDWLNGRYVFDPACLT